MPRSVRSATAPLVLLASSLGVAGCMAQPLQPASASATAAPVPMLVETTCSGCHAVTAGAQSPVAAAPAFADLALSPGLTEETLADFLADSNNYPDLMDVELDRSEAREIARYILSLKPAD